MENQKAAQPGPSAASTGSKDFTLGQVLSAMTGRLLCDIGGVYQVLNHITGDNLYTHVLPRACKFASPILKAHFPELQVAEDASQQDRLDAMLAKVEGPQKMKACQDWLDSLPLPKTLSVPSWSGSWLSFDPLQELQDMARPDQTVAVAVPQNTDYTNGGSSIG
jgi:hypothetical protein